MKQFRLNTIIAVLAVIAIGLVAQNEYASAQCVAILPNGDNGCVASIYNGGGWFGDSCTPAGAVAEGTVCNGGYTPTGSPCGFYKKSGCPNSVDNPCNADAGFKTGGSLLASIL
jgi:hypothetical protein